VDRLGAHIGAAAGISLKNAPRVFLRRLPVTLIAAIIIWLLLRPAIDWAVAGLAQALIRAFEYPRVTRLVVQDHHVQMRRSDLRTDSKVPSVSMTEVTFNTIVLLALYLALPRPFSRRQLERLFMGWCVLCLCQSVNLVFHVKTLYAMGLGEWSRYHYSDLARNVFGVGRYFTDLPGRFSFPFLIWLGFNWEVVMKMLNVSEDETEERKKASKRKKKKTKANSN
jgi:hypothetical protein